MSLRQFKVQMTDADIQAPEKELLKTAEDLRQGAAAGGAKVSAIVHRMTRRCHGWDYRQRAIYQITLVQSERREPLLGRLEVSDGRGGWLEPAAAKSLGLRPEQVEARVVPTPLGEAILAHWKRIGDFTPEIRPLYCQIMPDHIHAILEVTRPMAKPLGNAIGGFKTGCEKIYRKLALSAQSEELALSAQNEELALSAQNEKLALSAQSEELALSAQNKKLALSAQNEKFALSTQSEKLALSAQNEKLALSAQNEELALSAQNEELALSAQNEKLALSAQSEKLALSTQNEELALSAQGEELGRLWAEGFQDSILFRDGQLANMFNYLRDNPRRLAIKRLFPDLFRVVGELRVSLRLAPQAQNKAPQPQNKAPQAQNKAFQSQNKAFQSQNKAPQSQNKAPQAQNEAFQPQNKAPQAQNKALQAQNKAFQPQNEAFQPQNGAFQLQNGAFLAKGREPCAVATAQAVGSFSALGNRFLLDGPLLQVQVSRRDFRYRRVPKPGGGLKIARDEKGVPLVEFATPSFSEKSERLLMAAKRGTTLISPCVSDGEREIARRALEARFSLVTLANKGFSKLQKPSGRYFDACAEGRLLMLAPVSWPYVPGEKPMKREDALVLNRLAQVLAGDGAAEINYHGVTFDHVDEWALRAVNGD